MHIVTNAKKSKKTYVESRLPNSNHSKKMNNLYLLHNCSVCGEPKKPNCFNYRLKGYEDVCVKCRRKLGIESLQKRKNERKIKRRIKTKCMRCGKFFMSEVWGGKSRNRNRICEKCHDEI
jgi:hypothetical protein